MQRELDKHLYSEDAKHRVRIMRPQSANLDEWFKYLDSANERVSLKEIAHATKYNYSYVRRKYAQRSATRRGNKK